jgi:NAD(P)H dehydrogenase (quinone)
MHALLVIANPSPESFSHAMAKVAAEVLHAREYEVWYHELYGEHFDQVQPTGEAGNRRSSIFLIR